MPTVVMAELKYDGALFVSENQWQGPLYIGSLFQDQFTDFWRKIYPDIGARFDANIKIVLRIYVYSLFILAS